MKNKEYKLERCDYTFKNELGETIKCNNITVKENPNNRFYCIEHQRIVDGINKNRRIEANNKLKANIIQFFQFKNSKILRNITKKDLEIFIEKLENGDFDE